MSSRREVAVGLAAGAGAGWLADFLLYGACRTSIDASFDCRFESLSVWLLVGVAALVGAFPVAVAGATSRMGSIIPAHVVSGVLLAGGLGFASGLQAGFQPFAAGYEGVQLRYVGAFLGSLTGGSLGFLLAVRHKQ